MSYILIITTSLNVMVIKTCHKILISGRIVFLFEAVPFSSTQKNGLKNVIDSCLERPFGTIIVIVGSEAINYRHNYWNFFFVLLISEFPAY